jgi:hypothetical protein
MALVMVANQNVILRLARWEYALIEAFPQAGIKYPLPLSGFDQPFDQIIDGS